MAIVQVDSSNGDSNIYNRFVWLLAPALLFGVGAQMAIAAGSIELGVAGYLVAVVCATIGVQPGAKEDWAGQVAAAHLPRARRIGLIVIAILAGSGTFALSGGNLYRIEGVALWIISIVCWWLAWADIKGRTTDDRPQTTDAGPPPSPIVGAFLSRGAAAVASRRLLGRAATCAGNLREDLPLWGNAPLSVRRSSPGVLLALLAILALGAAFRFADLPNNPREMNSDHAEKLLDVRDVLSGTPYIFFERNTGREPWQFYWTVLLIKLFGLRADFMALKIGTALIGWLMLPAIFLLAREVFGNNSFGRRTALIATLFAAVASWGVITTRFGLRYPLAPCAVAWTMYFLVRGLRRNERNSMLAAGVWMGIGLQGYTAYRFMVVAAPLAVLAWVAWTLIQRKSSPARQALVNAGLAFIIAALVMLPLLRYASEHLDQLFYRAATRLSNAEKPIPGNPVDIFASNVKNVLLMFNYTHDEVWVANLPDRPAMDTVLGALLVLGAAGAFAISFKQRNLWPVMILASGVVMLIPSALSLAFPHENPSVVRTGGALPMLMIICAVVPGALLCPPRKTDERRTTNAGAWSSILFRLSSWIVVTAVCIGVIALNLQRVFVNYPAQYCPRAQNASDIAREMDAWVAAGNHRDNAWIIGYPHWVDTRAVGMWIGDITFANTAGATIGRMDAAGVNLHGGPGWFALNEQDAESLQSLKRRYTAGQARTITGLQCPAKRFIVFTTQ